MHLPLRQASLLRAVLLVAAALPYGVGPAAAPGYYTPPPPAPPTHPARSAPRAPPRGPAPTAQALPPPPPVQLPTGMPGVSGADAGDAGDQALAQMPNIPVPELPALPKGAVPPTVVIGVLGVPDIMRAATASKQVEQTIGERRQKLNEDAQKEQATWRDLQQQLAAQRGTMSPEQVHAKEQSLQDRITEAQKSFRERNRIIQETAQYSLGQIERTLIAVIRQVAESRGMNLVLHRAQVALNVNEFDITEQVTQQLNKVMPSITIPPDGVSPLAQAAAAPAAPAPTPASAPPSAPAARR